MQGGFLHVNRYSNGITTVNCVPVLRRDHEATDGLVHLLEGILSPASTASLPQLLMEDGRFREMARMMLRSEALVAQLRREPGPFTLLAPSDEAFQAMPPGQLQRISQDLNVTAGNKKDLEWHVNSTKPTPPWINFNSILALVSNLRTQLSAAADLIRNHVVPRSLCAPAIIAEHRVKSLSGDKLELSCNASGVYANEHRFTGEMMLGGNGHISVLTGILMTDKARSLVDLMAQRSDRLSTFVSLLADSGLASELSEGSFTVFAPTDDAFERVFLPTDSEALKKLLQRHLVPDRKIMSESFWDDAKLDTLEGGATLRLKVYRKSLGVDTAIITESDVEGHNGVVHVVNRVLEPPQGSVMEVLEKDDRFSLFAQALKRARELQLVNNYTQTVFAPTNEALSDYATDLENPSILENVVLSHIVDGLVPTGSFQSPKLSYDLVSERAHPLRVRMRGSNLTVNGVHVLRPDLLARDGIVHCVNGVLLPPSTEPGKGAGGN
ncbi:transforming growth factor-beta-induced protein ig-h3-like [Ixodes scapularis]|uniref:transforming growth factor-beta-induced protein ig-h3-like n=1 Tax=Ixodes scapularis TaxID=6945 RepID=UPI001A9D8C92|nr:transforming growth factor-beta-induced protein ig-h3-like [Ixodes scapularis]